MTITSTTTAKELADWILNEKPASVDAEIAIKTFAALRVSEKLDSIEKTLDNLEYRVEGLEENTLK